MDNLPMPLSDNEIPDVLIIADQDGDGLKPLSDITCLPLLTVGGKKIIEHVIESVASLNPAKVTVIAAPFVAELKQFLGEGTRWGVQLEVITRSGFTDAGELIQKVWAQSGKPMLVLDCATLRDFSVSDFYRQTLEYDAVKTVARCDAGDTGVYALKPLSLMRDSQDTEHQVPQFCADQDMQASDVRHIAHTLILGGVDVFDVTTLPGYHAANMTLVAGGCQQLTFRGRQRALGLITGQYTSVSPRSIKYGSVVAGQHSQVNSRASLSGTVVISDRVVVDRHTSITDSVILDNTYVGEYLNIRNAIVWKNLLIRVDSNTVLELSDNFLLADLGHSFYDVHLGGLVHSMGGLALLLASLPLWPIAVVLSLKRSSGKPYTSVILQGNARQTGTDAKTPFKAYQFVTGVPVLDNLPRLISVVTGRIRLVGVSLYKPVELVARDERWQKVCDTVPSGLLGPTQLVLGADAALEERLISDTVFSSTRDWKRSLHVLVDATKAFFSSRAWQSVPRNKNQAGATQ